MISHTCLKVPFYLSVCQSAGLPACPAVLTHLSLYQLYVFSRLIQPTWFFFQGDNHTSRFRMCDVDDNTTYISCDSNQLIVNVTAVSTMQEIHGCNASTDDVRERIHNLCVLTPSCTVSSAALGLNCSVPEICFNINYTCKRRFRIFCHW